MCFYNDDYDWCADVEKVEGVRGEVRRCGECSRIIASREWHTDFKQWEHEQCEICEDDYGNGEFISPDADDYDTDEEHAAALAELSAHEHSYGETFHGVICRECSLLLAAVWDLERIEGCPEHARQPAYGELSQTFHDSNRWDSGKYAAHAVALFPELATHQFITGE